MGYLHHSRIQELYGIGLNSSEIRQKIEHEYSIRLSIDQINKISRSSNLQGIKQNADRTNRLTKVIEEIIKGSPNPITARAITARIRSIHNERITKSEVNKIIHKHLRDQVTYNSYLFTYSWGKSNKEKTSTQPNNSDEIIRSRLESLIGDFNEFDLIQELQILFKNDLIKVSTGIDKIDYLIKSVVKDNIITECEEAFLKSKAKEFGYSEDIILDAKRSLKQNNPYLDNLIHIIFDDGQITEEELIFLKEKAEENNFTESFVNDRFWTIGLAEYLSHLIKYKPLDDILTLVFFSLKLKPTEDGFAILHQELNIFGSNDLSSIASKCLTKVKSRINKELEKEFGFENDYSSYILNEFKLDSVIEKKEVEQNSSPVLNVNLEKFMRLLNQERLRIGSPDVNLLVENINYRIENDLWD